MFYLVLKFIFVLKCSPMLFRDIDAVQLFLRVGVFVPPLGVSGDHNIVRYIDWVR